ncbi:sugar transferase [Macrococcoides caseolyticum]|uniref:sugar transferase n=1 Tax=Macrococcoides caseolyticum TaxID=69966 RepID=UPI000C34E775|nr:sugar transferase [Macrococcus caseolyticus]PKE45075.1 sugar transferase [Macrococcus caseolyticus]PKF21984.1 sugar transferase [Macrococcus caseolyticus]PKF36373.1 sugar transferase [Macrococcus caseolyticus]
MKRLFDFTLASVGILVVSPLIVGTAVVVKKKIGSPIIFKQTRPGQFGKPFDVYKFRTMTNETDENGDLLPDSDRLTDTGKFLRKYSLDELPQLINVIKGDISLVGPRPLLMEYNELYNAEQRRRLDVKPGITGWAQVNGRNALSWEEKFDLDVWYVENQSFLLDMYILYLTLYKVVKPEGINNSNETTMPLFEGTEIHRR